MLENAEKNRPPEVFYSIFHLAYDAIRKMSDKRQTQ